MSIELATTTGVERLDTLMQGLVALFEAAFPGRIRSYYLGGSIGDGTAVAHSSSINSSDLDLYVIFRGGIGENEGKFFQELVAASRLISGIQIDASAHAEDDLLGTPDPDSNQASFMNVLLRIAGQLVYGDDIRTLLPEAAFSRYILDVMESGIYHIGIPRQRGKLTFPLETPLTYPLDYPDPDGEFFGYEVVPARPDAPHGTRVLVANTAWTATLLLALETGRFAGRKSQSIQQCKTYLPDDWRAQLAVTIYETCKTTWGYAIPERTEDRQRLRDLCRQTRALENEYLRLCREYLLARLQAGEPGEQPQISRILQCVTYPDDLQKSTPGTL